MKQQKKDGKGTPEVEKLREAVQKKYHILPKRVQLDDIVITDILKDFDTNIRKFHDYYQNDGDTQYVKSNYGKTSDFRIFFESFPHSAIKMQSEIEGLNLKPERTTILSFINGETLNPSITKRDFFSICMEYGCIDSFSKNYPDADPLIKKYSEIDNISSSLKIEDQQLQIAGAEIIDADFIAKIKKGKLSIVEFYTAIKDSQWHGIINNCDIERIDYEKLKDAVITSLNQKREFKVAALVYGAGGVGKSTILRRLCIDIQKDNGCNVIWIDDVEEFAQQGISMIRKEIETNGNQKYLIAIEDWYRMFKNKHEIASKILEKLHKINNVRIVIGDRTIEGKPYEEYGAAFKLHLSSNENQEIIGQIIKNHPDWQLASEKLFKKPEGYNSTLFLLLFVLARVSQDQLDTASFNISDPQILFQNIIKSDLKFIKNKYEGLAKALYYWGCIYAQYKISISYKTFLKIADFFNRKNKDERENNEISDLFIRWDMDDDVLDKLKIYINQKNFVDEETDYELLSFNHDILSDIGLSSLSFENWDKFGDKIKIQLLKVITDNGDDYSASVFLNTMLLKEKKIFINQDDKLNFIKKLIEKNNREPHYIYGLTKLQMDSSTLEICARLLWDKKIENPIFWSKYFQEIKNETIIHNHISNILSKSHMSEYDPQFVCCVVKYAICLDERKVFADRILSGDLERINHEIIDVCLDYATENLRQDFLEKILQEHLKMEFENKNYHLLSFKDRHEKIKMNFRNYLYRMLNYEYYPFYIDEYLSYAVNDFKNKVLSDDDSWKKMSKDMLEYCINHTTNKIKRKFYAKVLLDDLWKETHEDIIYKCLYHTSKTIRRFFAKKVLEDEAWKDINSDLVCDCLSYANNKTSQTFSNKVIQDIDWKNTDKYILSMCLDFATDDEKKKFDERAEIEKYY